MYSNFIKFILVLISLSPIMLSYWIVLMIIDYKNLDIYFDFSSLETIKQGLKNFWQNHYLILLFVATVILCRYIFLQGIKNLSIGAIDLKQIKSVDVNFNPILISYILPWFKFHFKNNEDLALVIGSIIIYIIYAYIAKSSYHYNLIIRLLFNYKNYEVQTTGEVWYLMLSKQTLKNKKQVTRYIQISEHMLVNIKNTDNGQ
jgi:hypothetical protein